MAPHLEVCVGRGEEEFALDEVDLVHAALLHGCGHALGGGEVAADDERVCPEVVVEAEHHWVARLHHHV